MATSRSSSQSHVDPDDHDINLVEFWTQANVRRWIAGKMAGVLAGLITVAFGCVISAAMGGDPLFPIKLMATPILGSEATEYGMHVGAIVAGLGFTTVLGALLGFVFSHFVFTNHLPSLLAMGLVWGAFSWIFIWNLFFRSIRAMLFLNVSSATGLPFCMIFGISLASLAFFDRLTRKR